MKRKEKIGIYIAAMLTAWLLQHILNRLGIPQSIHRIIRMDLREKGLI